MKKILLTFSAFVALLVFGVLVAASLQPDQFRLERSMMTTANPGAVYHVMCDFNRFSEWSPFVKIDPDAKVSVSGPTCAAGSVYAWDGNDDVGAGSMTITTIDPNERIAIRLEFFRPMPSVAETTWAMQREGSETKITWVMTGTNQTLMEKVFCLLFMERMMGSMFDEGLASVKKLAEASSF